MDMHAASMYRVHFFVDTATAALLHGIHSTSPDGYHSSAGPSSQTVAVAGAVALVLAALIAGAIGIWTSRYTLKHQRVQQFNERFSTAAELIGHQQAATRLAGLYALAGLADDWKEHQQTCIHALCSYLRLPYESDPASPDYRRGEQEVRRTTIRIIRDHLREDFDTVSWARNNFSFEGAVFESGDLTGARFTGGNVSFHGTHFVSGVFHFNNVHFDGAHVWFTNACFDGADVHFNGAQFLSGKVIFDGAKRSKGNVSFDNANINDSVVKWGSFNPSAAARSSRNSTTWAAVRSAGGQMFRSAVRPPGNKR